MKIYNATPGFGRTLSKQEIFEFLSNSKKNLQLASLDKKTEPNIHPVWFLFKNNLIYLATERKSKKIQNIIQNDLIYFSIDEDNIKYRGVRGKGKAKVIDDIEFNKKIVKEILLKYTGSLEGKLAEEIMEEVENGIEIVLEITPKFFSTWEFTL